MTLVIGACDRLKTDSPEASESSLAATFPGVSGNDQGRELYAVCSVCHGEDARGTQLGPPLRGPDWIHIDGSVQSIEQITRSGVLEPSSYPVPMPPMGGGVFNEEELRALATYVHALGRPAG
jgi:mono/diheme cytochrome c family protein